MEIRESGDGGKATGAAPDAAADPATRYAPEGFGPRPSTGEHPLFAGLPKGVPAVLGHTGDATGGDPATDTATDAAHPRPGALYTVDGGVIYGARPTAVPPETSPRAEPAAVPAEAGRPDGRGLVYDVPDAAPAVLDGRYGRGPVPDAAPARQPSVAITRDGVLVFGGGREPSADDGGPQSPARDTDATADAGDRSSPGNPFAVDLSGVAPAVITTPHGYERASGASDAGTEPGSS